MSGVVISYTLSLNLEHCESRIQKPSVTKNGYSDSSFVLTTETIEQQMVGERKWITQGGVEVKHDQFYILDRL